VVWVLPLKAQVTVKQVFSLAKWAKCWANKPRKTPLWVLIGLRKVRMVTVRKVQVMVPKVPLKPLWTLRMPLTPLMVTVRKALIWGNKLPITPPWVVRKHSKRLNKRLINRITTVNKAQGMDTKQVK
jgi:hypothetical protein